MTKIRQTKCDGYSSLGETTTKDVKCERVRTDGVHANTWLQLKITNSINTPIHTQETEIIYDFCDYNCLGNFATRQLIYS